jgi:hypothetical protein
MTFKVKKKYAFHKKVWGKVKGIFVFPIQYEVRVADGNWTSLISTDYEPQKWGQSDSDCCWCLSSCNSVEMQLNLLKNNNMFSPEALNFFQSNGYYDSNGMFALSERYLEILSGATDTGGAATEAATLMQVHGLIPRSVLGYSVAQAQKWVNQSQFDADYFNPSAVTPAMQAIGAQFLTFVNIAYQRIGTEWTTPPTDVLSAALCQAPVNYGIPVNDMEWNQVNVPAVAQGDLAHEVTGYQQPNTAGYPILDQYNPWFKVLMNGYFLGSCIQIIVTAIQPAAINPVPQNHKQDSIWTIIMNWLNGIGTLLGKAKAVAP